MTTVERECRSSWYADTGRIQNRGDREVRCSLEQGHDGHHIEHLDGEPDMILVAWDRRKVEPRTWSLPAEPGPEVTAVRDRLGQRWTRDGEGWSLPGAPFGGHCCHWIAVVFNGPLTDATGEQS